MDIKRVLWVGVLFYLVNLLFAYILNYLTPSGDVNNYLVLFGGIVVLIISTGLFSWWYFKGRKIKKGWKEGLYLGLIWLVLTLILDIISIYVVGGDPIGSGNFTHTIQYYLTWQYGLNVVLLLVTSSLVGKIKK